MFRELLKVGSGSAQPQLTAAQVKGFKIVTPPIELQNQFAAIVKKIEGLKSYYQQSLSNLEYLYNALCQKAFKGELDLSRVPLSVEDEKSFSEQSEKVEEELTQPTLSDFMALTFPEGRRALLDQWFDHWIEELGDAPFSAQSFMGTAQQRLTDLADQDLDEESVELEDILFGKAEYDYLRKRVFEMLETGRLKQIYEDSKNQVQVILGGN